MTGLIVVSGFACACGVVALLLLGDWCIRKMQAWRERRAMRRRDAELQRFSMTSFRGTKERQL